jgi:hypothetical protein
LLLIVWLLLHSTLDEAKASALAAAAGLLIYLAYQLYSRAKAQRRGERRKEGT